MENPRIVLQSQIKEAIRVILEVLNRSKDKLELFDFKVENSRGFGEILLHMIRSIEYYLRGVAMSQWEFLPYTVEEYNTFGKCLELFTSIIPRLEQQIKQLNGEKIHQKFENQNSFGLNLVIEMIHHIAHHIGQLSIYMRMNSIEPVEMKYFI